MLETILPSLSAIQHEIYHIKRCAVLAEINTSLSAVSQFAVCFANLRACRKTSWAAKVAAQEKTAITYSTDALLYKSHGESAEARHHALLLGFTSAVPVKPCAAILIETLFVLA